MRKVSRQLVNWRNVVFLLIALGIIAADQFTKIWIRSNLALGQSIPETGFFRLTHVRNTGAVFGLFKDHTFPLTIVSLVAIALLLLYIFYLYRHFPYLDNKLGKAALGLIFGGIVGNLIDRMHFGYVTDFVDVGLWPSFNVADSALTIGVTITALFLLYQVKAEQRQSSA
jgi:signal peptidase II